MKAKNKSSWAKMIKEKKFRLKDKNKESMEIILEIFGEVTYRPCECWRKRRLCMYLICERQTTFSMQIKTLAKK